jgi:precorrin-2/cobalt-factor-2 C20-methyltransferase
VPPVERTGARDAASTRVLALLDAGEEVAFITLGDPNVYSTFSSIASAVETARPSTPIETVPGVMAFQELAARAHVVLTDEQQSLVLLPANSDDDALDGALGDGTRTIILYKGGRRLPDVASRLKERSRLDGAVLGELLGLPGERIVAVADVADRPASYLSSVIVPAKEGA